MQSKLTLKIVKELKYDFALQMRKDAAILKKIHYEH